MTDGTRRTTCRHCGRDKVNRPRGLCWACYYRDGVREQYPSESKFGRRGVLDSPGKVRIPLAATMAEPGSEAKIAVMQQRAEDGTELHHPDDVTLGVWWLQ